MRQTCVSIHGDSHKHTVTRDCETMNNRVSASQRQTPKLLALEIKNDHERHCLKRHEQLLAPRSKSEREWHQTLARSQAGHTPSPLK